MRNKKNLIILVGVILAISFLSLWGQKFIKPKEQKSVVSKDESTQIEYWTCSMHPQVRKDSPGKCPICGMELIAVYKEDIGRIVLDKSTQERLGVKSELVEYRHLIKLIRLPGKVSHDYELYTLQQEYLSILSSFHRLKETGSKEIMERQKNLLETTKLRLKLLGFDEKEIENLGKLNVPDESLIYPVKGKVWVHADIYEQDLGLVKVGQKVRAKIKGYEPEEFLGEIKAIEVVLSPQTRSAKARIEIFDPDNKLKHEVFADLTLEIGLGKRLSIPKTSLIDTGTRQVVYIDLGDGRYQLRQIKVGVEARGYVEALEGLKDKDSVVTDGNFLLDSQTTLTGGQALLYGAGEEIKEAPKEPKHRH